MPKVKDKLLHVTFLPQRRKHSAWEALGSDATHSTPRNIVLSLYWVTWEAASLERDPEQEGLCSRKSRPRHLKPRHSSHMVWQTLWCWSRWYWEKMCHGRDLGEPPWENHSAGLWAPGAGCAACSRNLKII